MLKKFLIGFGIFILVIILTLVSIPLLFKDKIKEAVTGSINENLEAVVAFDDVTLNLFKSFPQANVSIQKLSIINKAPFEGDTLVSIGEVNLKMSITELFKGKTEAMNIKSIYTKDGFINIHVNKENVANYDIAMKKDEAIIEKANDDSSALALTIKDYSIENYKIQYYDETSKMKMVLTEINHKGKGNFAASILDLDTKTTAKISFDMDQSNFMRNIAVSLDAIIGIDLERRLYTFKEDKALINQLPLEFKGTVQLVDAGQLYDLKFNTPTSSFKNFLGLIPAEYSKSLDKVETTGEFTVFGKVNGVFGDTTIPKFKIEIASQNASFKYPDLPKGVQNIVIDTKIINETGNVNDTYVDLNKLSFKIDQDLFSAKANIHNLMKNALVNAELKGIIDLANLTKVYPIQLDKPLAGILKVDIITKFDMKSVETNQYQNIQNSGSLSLSKFQYTDDTNKIFNINQATVQFNPSRINLEELDLTTGKTDLKVSGILDNFYGFLFKNQELKGNFDLKSNQFVVTDFMSTAIPVVTTETKTTETKEKAKTAEAIKIPKFLNCTLNASVNTIVYDNLNLKNASGTMIIKNETVRLQNVKTSVFDGQIVANGMVSTKENTPTFNMDLGMNAIDITQSFTQLDMLKTIAPIANVVTGKLNSTVQLSGKLDPKKLTPDLNTLSGNMVGQLVGASLDPSKSTILSALDSNLKFIDLKRLSLNDQKIHLAFNNGKVDVKPFDIKLQDINVNVGGQHGFDQSLNYNVKLDVPAKYLGAEANKILASLSPAEVNKVKSVPITATITGNFSNPKVGTDLQKAVASLATQLVQKQKDKLITQGTNALGNLLEGKKETDSTKSTTTSPKEDITEKATEALKGLFGKKKKE